MTEPVAAPPAIHPLRRLAVRRLLFFAGLFALWMLYLGYLVLMRPEVPSGPRLLSRPQALISSLDVVAEITDPKQNEVVIQEVLYPADRKNLEGTKLTVANLDRCGRYVGRDFVPDVTGPGTYLLLLQLREDKQAEVVPLPLSPRPGGDYTGPRAYAATSDVLSQYRQVVKPAS
jgi:hypothetical protein